MKYRMDRFVDRLRRALNESADELDRLSVALGQASLDSPAFGNFRARQLALLRVHRGARRKRRPLMAGTVLRRRLASHEEGPDGDGA